MKEKTFRMKIVVLASEAVPFSKTGGLADVAGALPRALEALGHEAILMIPFHRRFLKPSIVLESVGLNLRVPIGPKIVEGQVFSTTLEGSKGVVYLIDQPDYFDRDGLYQSAGVDYHDNFERFLFFCRASLETIRLLELAPDVLHCNDWQTGLTPVYLAEQYRVRAGLERVGTLLTIHNLAYQGTFSRWAMGLTGLDARLFNWEQLEFHGKLNCLKAGIVFADRVSTVSPTYAKEIQTAEFGCGLEGLLSARRDQLTGIVNGIDTTVWNPETDPMIALNYDIATFERGKAACKAQLQRRSSLPERPDVPLLAQIGRLDPQKGWDLLAEVADGLLDLDIQLVILGEGAPRYHELLDRLADKHPGKLRAFLEFSNPLAHQIEAGADLFLMPSLYEPCGLNQLYSLAYGTIPIVRATGGLADTVVDAAPATLSNKTATGFSFVEPNPRALRGAIDRALAAFADRSTRREIIANGMSRDWSWNRGASEYAQLYQEILSLRSSKAAG